MSGVNQINGPSWNQIYTASLIFKPRNRLISFNACGATHLIQISSAQSQNFEPSSSPNFLPGRRFAHPWVADNYAFCKSIVLSRDGWYTSWCNPFSSSSSPLGRSPITPVFMAARHTHADKNTRTTNSLSLKRPQRERERGNIISRFIAWISNEAQVLDRRLAHRPLNSPEVLSCCGKRACFAKNYIYAKRLKERNKV